MTMTVFFRVKTDDRQVCDLADTPQVLAVTMRSMIHNSVMVCSVRVCIVHLCLKKCAGFFNNYEHCGGVYAGAS